MNITIIQQQKYLIKSRIVQFFAHGTKSSSNNLLSTDCKDLAGKVNNSEAILKSINNRSLIMTPRFLTEDHGLSLSQSHGCCVWHAILFSEEKS